MADRYFITGGMGFIGSHLAERILSEGGDVLLYDAYLNFTSPEHSRYADYLAMRKDRLGKRVTIVEGDTRDGAKLQKTLSEFRPAYIVHLAALADAMKCREYPDEATGSNVDGTRNVLSTLKDLPPVQRFVFFSSSFVYGNFQYYPADEDHQLKPIDIYGETKLLGECLVQEFCTEYRVPFTIVRPSAVYGFGDANRRVVQLFLENAIMGESIELYGGGHSAIDFTNLTDLVDGTWRVLSHAEANNEVFNITRGRGRAIEELAAIVLRHFPEVTTRIKFDQKTRPNRGPLDITKCRSKLGYNPRVDLEAGVARYIEKLKQNEQVLR